MTTGGMKVAWRICLLDNHMFPKQKKHYIGEEDHYGQYGIQEGGKGDFLKAKD